MKKIVFGLIILASAVGFSFGQQKTSGTIVAHPKKVITGKFLGVVGPVKDFHVLTKEEIEKKIKEEKEKEYERNEGIKDRRFPFLSSALPIGDDPVWQKSIPKGAKAQPIILQNFEGGTGQGIPSDVNGTAGPNHYMQVYNLSFIIYNKDGSVAGGPYDMNSLFGNVEGAQNNDGDPVILYDEQADRWVAIEFSINSTPYHMLFAVSQTNDPMGSWYAYSFVMPGFPDYEKVGIWQDGYYMGTNTYDNDDVFVVERNVMLSGGSNPQIVEFDNPYRPNSGFHCIQPVDNDGTFAPSGTPGMFITINDDAWNGGSDQLWIYQLDVDWSNVNNSTFTRTQTINVPAFSSAFNTQTFGEDLVQKGSSQKLDAISTVLMFRAQYRNFGNEQVIVACHTVDVDGTDHAGIRWYELTNTGNGWSIRQSGTYAPDGENRWMGSIAINASHEIAIGYSLAGPNNYPSLRFAGQSASEHANASGILDVSETTIINGAGPQDNYSRWGDYFEISVDPTDNTTFWFTGQYVGSQYPTQTRIVSFKFQETGDPENLQAQAVSENQINVSWNLNSNNDPVLLAWASSNSFGTPQNGTTYGPGDAIPGGGTVLYYGSNTSYNHTGLQPSTTYYYKAWSYLPSNEYSPGVTTSTTTEAAPINSFPFTWDFESSADYTTSFDPWTAVDGDGANTYGSSSCDFQGEGSAFAYMAFNTSDCWESSEGDAAHSGVRVGMASCPAPPDQNTAPPQSDDWFISPKLSLGTNSSFSFWALSPKPGSWGNDEFEVLVSTTDNNPSSFTPISNVTEAPANWQQFTYDLSNYDNQDIYVAIHHVSTDMFMLWIDDLEINSDVVTSISNNNAKHLTITPNPARNYVEIKASKDMKQVKLTSVEGKTLIESNIYKKDVRLDINNLKAGVYLLEINYTDGSTKRTKIIKE